MDELEKKLQPEIEHLKPDMLQIYQENLALHQTLRNLLVRLTRSSDWIDFEGRPYLCATGAEAIASVLGISWDQPALDVEDLGNGHRRYTYSTIFRWRDREIGAIGIRASNEKFFCMRKTKDGVTIELPGDEVDHANVMVAAYTNLLNNGIKRILGIRSLSWEDIAQHKPKQQTESPQVQFSGLISTAQQHRLWAIAREHGRTQAQVREILRQHGYESTAQIKRADYEAIIEKIKAGDAGVTG